MSTLDKLLRKNLVTKISNEALAKALNNFASKTDEQSKKSFAPLNKELVRRLSLASPEGQKEIQDSLTATVKARLLEDYKKIYNDLFVAVDVLADKVIKDFLEKKSWGEEGSDKGFYSRLPEEYDLRNEMKTGTINKLHFPLSSETSIYHPTIQIKYLSELKKAQLTDKGEKLNACTDWTEYRGKTLSVIEKLNSFKTKILIKGDESPSVLEEIMSESSPHLRAFYDAVNRICEWLGSKNPFKAFDPSKVQEFKHRLFNINTALQKIDNPVEIKEIFEPENQQNNKI
ncbi:MAG: hypothetical protein H0U73_06165 [Tatlockia sp.]|nr:hypothetical protein [Tatlockia sp.]